MDPRSEQIGEKHIDIEQILAAKNVKIPRWAMHVAERILHIPDLNRGIYLDREYFGLQFVHKFLEGHDDQDLGLTIRTVGEENIPREGFPMVVGNHPLGGPDGLALMGAVGRVRQDVLFPVNDFLLYLPGLKELFVPIDKVNKTKSIAALEAAFAGENVLCYYPAGACSRRMRPVEGGKKVIRDLDWKPTFVKKAVRYRRDVVPVYTEACNRKSFYRWAELRKRLGIKFSFEMALLPGEMYAQRGKTITLTFGHPIPWQTFDHRHTAAEWAALVKEHVYRLKDNPQTMF